jgi:hypothetical protein
VLSAGIWYVLKFAMIILLLVIHRWCTTVATANIRT